MNRRTTSSPSDCDDSFVVVDVVPVDSVPSTALQLSVTPLHEMVGKDNKNVSTTQMCATIQASKLPDDNSNRAPVDIVVALDVSWSMTGEKLKLCKMTLELLLRQLLPQDRFGLVSFSDEATLEIPVRKLAETNPDSAKDKIKLLRTRRGTNISGGIGLAAKEMMAIKHPNEVRSIFLLTDGQANRGVSDAAGIVGITNGCLNQSKDDGLPPITIHFFGYGTDHDEKLLVGVSEATPGGSYYFVENDWNIATAFGDALGGILSVVAQNVVVDITVPPSTAKLGAEIVDVYHERKFNRDGHSFTVSLGDFYAEESRDVLFEIKLTTSQEDDIVSVPHVSLLLSYMDTIKKQLIAGDPITSSISRPPGTAVSPPSHHVAVHWLRVHTAQELALADQLCQRGDFAGARAKLQECRRVISCEDSLRSYPLVSQLLLDLDRVLGGLTSHQEYKVRGAKLFKGTFQAHTTQRGFTSDSIYRSSEKARMTARFQLGYKRLSCHAAAVAAHATEFYDDVSTVWVCLETDPCLKGFRPGEGYPPGVVYWWSDHGEEAISVPAPVYIGKVLNWIRDQINDPSKFPDNEIDATRRFQTKTFAELCGRIFRRLFRVYAIIYSSFFNIVEALNLAPHLNACFKSFIFFCFEFELLPDREIEPVEVLVKPLKKQYVRSKEKQTRSPAAESKKHND